MIVSGNNDNANVATIAWIGIVSSTPPTIGVSFNKTRHSLHLIEELKEFTVNIPSSDQYKEVDYCGLVSGKKENKFDKNGFTLMNSSKVSTPIIKECPFNMECIVVQKIELGDYVLILGEIVDTHIDIDKIDTVNNKISIDMAKVSPLVYCAKSREYWSLGKKLGNAFEDGKEILKDKV